MHPAIKEVPMISLRDVCKSFNGKKVLDGLSIEEAAARTGQSASLVKVNIHRGLGRLARGEGLIARLLARLPVRHSTALWRGEGGRVRIYG
jgi:hypothetical protein